MLHAVSIVMERYYKVYVEDKDNSMTREQIEAEAKKSILDAAELYEVDDFDYQEEDIKSVSYDPKFDDIDDDD